MTSILTNTADIAQPWARHHLQKVLKPGMKACILAMSDFDNVRNQEDWEKDYAPGGTWHGAYEKPLHSYGIREIVWLSPFKNSRFEMLQAIEETDLLVLPGGAPDLFMKRIRRFGLKKAIRSCQLLFGISAGAMIQLGDYHITPDEDYAVFSWQTGLGLLPFDLECHFTGSRHQREYLDKAKEEKGLETWALYEDGGLLVQDGVVTAMGRVERHAGNRD